jgi:hypothetical protein
MPTEKIFKLIDEYMFFLFCLPNKIRISEKGILSYENYENRQWREDKEAGTEQFPLRQEVNACRLLSLIFCTAWLWRCPMPLRPCGYLHGNAL